MLAHEWPAHHPRSTLLHTPPHCPTRAPHCSTPAQVRDLLAHEWLVCAEDGADWCNYANWLLVAVLVLPFIILCLVDG